MVMTLSVDNASPCSMAPHPSWPLSAITWQRPKGDHPHWNGPSGTSQLSRCRSSCSTITMAHHLARTRCHMPDSPHLGTFETDTQSHTSKRANAGKTRKGNDVAMNQSRWGWWPHIAGIIAGSSRWARSERDTREVYRSLKSDRVNRRVMPIQWTALSTRASLDPLSKV